MVLHQRRASISKTVLVHERLNKKTILEISLEAGEFSTLKPMVLTVSATITQKYGIDISVVMVIMRNFLSGVNSRVSGKAKYN